MPKKIVLSFLAVLLAACLSACSVMQATYQKKVDEADALDEESRRAAEEKRRPHRGECRAQGRPGEDDAPE